MSLKQKIDSDYINAYKTKESLALGVLRLIKTAIKNLEVDLRREVSDEEVLDLILKQAKQRLDSIDQFTKAQRLDLADKEQAELEFLNLYLPKKLSESELQNVIAQIISDLAITDLSGMGKVMQKLSSDYKGQFDGKMAGQAVRDALEKK